MLQKPQAMSKLPEPCREYGIAKSCQPGKQGVLEEHCTVAAQQQAECCVPLFDIVLG